MRDQAAVTVLATAPVGLEADRRISFEAVVISLTREKFLAR